MTAVDIGQVVKEACASVGGDSTRMVDVVRAVQGRLGCVPGTAMEAIAAALGTHRVEVESVVSFYAFLSERPRGEVVIRLCNDVIDRMHGADHVGEVLEQELGIRFGGVTEDGAIGLERTPCIGMSDQAPAALVGDVVVTNLSTDSARELVRELKRSGDPRKLVHKLGDGNNAHELVRSMVENNLRKAGEVVFAPLEKGTALRKALAMSPAEVIRELKTARLRGRGGAGFPTGIKWEFARAADGANKAVICNADEGEPGTFKDRVILTERPHLVLEGMTIAGYAIGAEEGVLYLRAEYAYLRRFLEAMIEERCRAGLLGRDVMGKKGFHFDIRVQMGAGAYVCGEETALISSCEGLRGDPKNRPPFPAQKGLLGRPTVVNNVETLCCVARILEEGAGWFARRGNQPSAGTKVLSVSGDCLRPGVYELPFGIALRELLELVGAEETSAVQVGGPSGKLVPPAQFERKICFEDLATGGSIMVFGPERDLLDVARQFLEFFVEESCGYCTPCRAGNVLLLERLERVLEGNAGPEDLDYLRQLAEGVKLASRCGLGQTSPNPVLCTLESFRPLYEARFKKSPAGLLPTFDIHKALEQAKAVTGRDSVHFRKG